MLDENLPNKRRIAISLKCKFYFTGKPCKFNHLSKRYSSNGKCKTCQDIFTENRTKSGYYKDYRKNNLEKFNKTRKLWVDNNIEKVRQSKRKSFKKRIKNPKFKLNRNISWGIWKCLKEGKLGKHWEEFVKFSKEELISHLEKQFTPEMTWENYGSYWEVDHIKPLDLCENFEEAWKLSNLQPLTCKDNRSKRNSYIGHPNNRIEVEF